MLHVSNNRLFDHLDLTKDINKYNTKFVPEPEKSLSVVNTSLRDLALKAIFNTSSSDHMYATQLVAFSGEHNIYSLMQCTLDLSSIDCQLSLQNVMFTPFWHEVRTRCRLHED